MQVLFPAAVIVLVPVQLFLARNTMFYFGGGGGGGGGETVEMRRWR